MGRRKRSGGPTTPQGGHQNAFQPRRQNFCPFVQPLARIRSNAAEIDCSRSRTRSLREGLDKRTEVRKGVKKYVLRAPLDKRTKVKCLVPQRLTTNFCPFCPAGLAHNFCPSEDAFVPAISSPARCPQSRAEWTKVARMDKSCIAAFIARPAACKPFGLDRRSKSLSLQ